MKRSRRWLCLVAVAALVAGLALPAAAAKKVTLLIHPTLFKAAGGPKGVVADLGPGGGYRGGHVRGAQNDPARAAGRATAGEASPRWSGRVTASWNLHHPITQKREEKR